MTTKRERRLGREQKRLDRDISMPYTKSERNTKINTIFLQLMQLEMVHTLTPEIKKGIFDFRDHGTTFEAELKLPLYNITMMIHFDNNKRNDANNCINIIQDNPNKYTKQSNQGKQDTEDNPSKQEHQQSMVNHL